MLRCWRCKDYPGESLAEYPSSSECDVDLDDGAGLQDDLVVLSDDSQGAVEVTTGGINPYMLFATAANPIIEKHIEVGTSSSSGTSSSNRLCL